MNGRNIGLSQADAASIAEISTRSGQRIEAGSHQPNRGRMAEKRTVPDPLAGVWESELEPLLRREPRLKPMTLFEHLQEHHPGQYPQVLRTLQRRVRTWKALHGPSPDVMFELRHEPGVQGFSDFTELKGITVTIGGAAFEHLLYHYRLGYSGWQYAQIIQGGESFIALSEGLQNALTACGGVPHQHRTDSLSAAYRNMGGRRSKNLTRLYDELCEHYRLEPTRNNKGIAHENGAIESSHGHLKNRIKQALYLRGSFDFASVDEYQAFIDKAVAGLNQQCQQKYEQEKSYLQPLPKYRVADYEVLTATVSSRSTIDVRCILYTVPSRLMGRQLELHLYHDHIVGYLERQPVVELPRVRVTDKDKRRGRCINYRHVIAALHHKPRAFIYCTWQSNLLPNAQYRQLWQQLKTLFDVEQAANLIVEALYIAATQDKENAVAEFLAQQLLASSLTLNRLKKQFQPPQLKHVPELSIEQHPLASYDQLLPSHCSDNNSESLRAPESLPQKAETLVDAHPLGIYRIPSYAATMVLCAILVGLVRIGDPAPRTNSLQARRHRSATAKRKKFYQL
jgi:hypothetical protein